MGLEIERKFLVEGDFKSQSSSHSRIIQGYISSQRGRTVRVRLRDEKGYLTIKGPSAVGGLTRYEFEQEISKDDALSLLHLCEPGIIDKVRWLVPIGQHVFEVDEFFGENEGLVIAEVELAAEDEAYEKPDFIAQEVTGDRRYYNSMLRLNPYKNWNKEETQTPGAKSI
jgi:CYTH domain-containing protein